MKLFEENTQEVQEAAETVKVQDTATYDQVVEFCITNGVQLTKDQIKELQESFITESEVPTSDNSAIKDEEFKTEENSRGEDPIIDAAKDDSAQDGKDPCPAHIEDEIEDEGKKNDEFVNDADEDTIKNETVTDIENNTYVKMLEAFALNGVKMNDEQLEALKEEFLLEAKTESYKARRTFIDVIRKKVEKLFEEEGIRMFLQETPGSKKFKNGETDSFQLQFSAESKGVRIAQGILTYGQSELYRSMFASGSNANRATQEAVRDFINDCEDDVADIIEKAGKDCGFEASLARISLNGIKVKAILKGDAIETNDNMKAVKKQERADEKAKKAEWKAEAKADKEKRKEMKKATKD